MLYLFVFKCDNNILFKKVLLFLYGEFCGIVFFYCNDGFFFFYFVVGVWGEDWIGYYCVDGYGYFLGVNFE